MAGANQVTLGGGRVLESYLKKLSKQVATPGHLDVGFLEGATYPNGTPVAMVAAIQEFGAPDANIPPRPFFRTAIQHHSEEWGPALAHQLKETRFNVVQSLSAVGQGIEGQVRQSIVDLQEPPLSPLTLMLRKMKAENPHLEINGKILAEAKSRLAKGETTEGVSVKPLVDSAHMLNSISSRVRS